MLGHAADAVADATRDARFSSRPPKRARRRLRPDNGNNHRQTRMGRPRLVVLTVLILVVLGGVGAYALGGYLGEGIPEEPWIATEEASTRVPELGADIPIPPGRDFKWRGENYGNLPGVIQEAGVVETLAYDAVCMWADEWLRAREDGDVDRESRAHAMILTARDWPYWTVINAEYFDDYLTGLADSMDSGSSELVEDELELTCPDYTTAP
jgi:hypothetical protein